MQIGLLEKFQYLSFVESDFNKFQCYFLKTNPNEFQGTTCPKGNLLVRVSYQQYFYVYSDDDDYSDDYSDETRSSADYDLNDSDGSVVDNKDESRVSR